MNELMIFNSEEFGQVRTMIINDEPWFVGKDVAAALGYKKITEALQTNVDEMDSTLMGVIDSMGRNQQTKVINESGLYALIFGSKLPSAKRFKHWVTSEVLPSIRKTGSYTLTNTEQKKANLLLSIYNGGQEGVLASRELTKIEIDEATLPLKQEIKEQKETIDHKEDVIQGLTDEITLPEMRQVLNKVLNHKTSKFQERWGALYKEFELKYHCSLKRRMESYNKKNKPKCKTKLDYIDKVMNQLPDLYALACKLYESDIKAMIAEMYHIAKTD